MQGRRPQQVASEHHVVQRDAAVGRDEQPARVGPRAVGKTPVVDEEHVAQATHLHVDDAASIAIGEGYLIRVQGRYVDESRTHDIVVIQSYLIEIHHRVYRTLEGRATVRIPDDAMPRTIDGQRHIRADDELAGHGAIGRQRPGRALANVATGRHAAGGQRRVRQLRHGGRDRQPQGPQVND